MGRGWSQVVLVGLLELVAMAPSATAKPATLYVNIRNDAAVPADTLAAALSIAWRIYQLAGVKINWVSEGEVLTIVIRPRPSAETNRRAAHALGYTPSNGKVRSRIAIVLLNRVTDVAQGYNAQLSTVLGVAIAHELGHLTVGHEHSPAGLMKPYFNQADFRAARERRLRLTAAQAEQLRLTLQGENRD